MNENIQTELDSLAFDFFKKFARYEFFLKAAGFAESSRGGVVVCWNEFADNVGDQALQAALDQVKEASDYILDAPPKVQAIKDGLFEWKEPTSGARTPKDLISHLRRIRNNLFHGGKFGDFWIDQPRSRTLLRSGIQILDALEKLRPAPLERFRQ